LWAMNREYILMMSVCWPFIIAGGMSFLISLVATILVSELYVGPRSIIWYWTEDGDALSLGR